MHEYTGYLFLHQERPPCIPDSVQQKRAKMDTGEKKRTERDLELEQGDDYFLDLKSKSRAPNVFVHLLSVI